MSSGEQRADQNVRRAYSSHQPARERRRDTTQSLRSADRLSRRNEKRHIPTLPRQHTPSGDFDGDDDNWASSSLGNDASSGDDVWGISDDNGDEQAKRSLPSEEELQAAIDTLRSPDDSIAALRRLDQWLSGRELTTLHHVYRVAGGRLVRALKECIKPLDHDSDQVGQQSKRIGLAVRCVAHMTRGTPDETELLRPVLPGLKIVLEDVLRVDAASSHFEIFDAAAQAASALANLSLESHAAKRLLADNRVVETLQRVFVRMSDIHNSADEPLWRRFTSDRAYDNPVTSPLDPISNVLSCTAFALSTFYQRSPGGGEGPGSEAESSLLPVDCDGILFRTCQSTLTSIFTRHNQQLCECPPDREPQLGTLLSELLWLTVYTSSRLPPSQINRLLEENIDKLVRLFNSIARVNALAADVQIPALRTLGNILNICDDLLFRQAFGTFGGQLLEVLVRCLRRDHRVIIKETGWLLRCLSQRSLATEQFDTIVDSSELVDLVVTERFKLGIDVRQEFAFFVLLLLKRKAFLPKLKQHCLEPFLQLLKVRDPQISMMALEFTELCLALPGGPRAVELADGIEALEYLQHHTSDPGLARFIGGLVDKHYGENYE